MPLMNSMGAFKQQHAVTSVTPPVSYSNFYSATDFNLTTDTNFFGVNTAGAYPYIFGSSTYSSTNYSFILKMNPATGAITQKVVYSDSSTRIKAVVVDSSGYFHVLRTTSATSFDLIKYNSSWGYVTSKSFSGGNFGTNLLEYKLSIDGSNNLYFVSNGSVSGTIAILKIDSSYNVVFAKNVTTGTNASYFHSTIDSSGNVYIVGTGTNNAYVQKISTAGAISWQKSFNDSNLLTTTKVSTAITIDSSDNVYVAMATNDNSQRVFVNKFSSGGSVLFNKTVTLSGTFSAVAPQTFGFNSDGNLTLQLGDSAVTTLFFVELSTSGTILNQSYITGITAASITSIQGVAGPGKTYITYTDESNSNIQMMTLLSVPNTGYFGSSPATYNYTYNGATFNNTLTAYTTSSYTIATNATAWNNTAFTIADVSVTTGTPTLTTSSVVPFNHNQTI